jgi:choline dehydrogenase-like flavoprotein
MSVQDFDANTNAAAGRPVDPSSICVVGSGPVGLAFALRLANAGRAVTLLDSGSFSAHDKGREFNLGTITSAANAADRTDPTLVKKGTLYSIRDYLAMSRYLGSGGTSWRWSVKWRPATEARLRIVSGDLADFEARPEFGIPAWAASGSEVCNRYPDALAFFDLEDQNFKVDNYQDSSQPIPLPSHLFPTRVFHFPPAAVIRHNRMNDVLTHPGIDVRSGLHLLRLETDHQEKVTGVIMVNQDGQEQRIEAAHYVLALGGIENSRQLLLAKQDGALGDPHDVFGRWFCDHPHTRFGFLNVQDQEILHNAANWYDFQEIQGTPVLRGHEIAPSAARDLGLLRFSVDIVGRSADWCSRSSVALVEAKDASERRDLKTMVSCLPGLASSPMRSYKLAHHALNSTLHSTALGGWSDPVGRHHSIETLAVDAMFEQRPSPDNRVRLGQKRDRLGRQLPVLQWSWSQQEIDSINQASELMAETFHQLGVGSFVTMRELGQGKVPRAGTGFHHMGGTRQSHDPADGVVNAENRVHGVENLTLLGTSIFPNSVGYANPTLNAVADAIRVADLFTNKPNQ